MFKFLMIAITVLALTACGVTEDNQGSKDARSADVAAAKNTFDAISVRSGLWETKITFETVDAKGLPNAAKQQMMAAMGDGVTFKNCVSQEQSEKPGAEFFGSPDSSNCTVNEMSAAGNRISVKLSCKPESKAVIESSMNGVFGADSYSMNVRQKTSGTPIGDLITTGKINGKRLGDCPA